MNTRPKSVPANHPPKSVIPTREGYKMTEVGVIPDDWSVALLGDLVTLMTNGFVGTATTHYSEDRDSVLYIQGYNVKANSFNFHGIKRVSAAFHKNHLKSCLREDDLLTVQTGDVGLTTIVPRSLVGSNCHALIITRFKKNRAFPRFYSHYFNSSTGRNRLKEIETGTTMKHLNVGDMLDWKIPLPPTLTEQRAIATALSDVDALIASLDRLIEKKKAIKQGAMQELLMGKTRLAGFGNGVGYKMTEGGRVPEDWEVRKLSTIGTFFKGKGIKKDEVLTDGIPCIRYGELYTKYENLIYDIQSFISEEIAATSFKLKLGDILFAGSGETREEIGKSAALMYSDEIYAGGDIVVLRPSGISSRLLGYLLNSNAVVRQKSMNGQGDAVVHIYSHGIGKIIIPIPSDLAEQEAIAGILSDSDAEIQSIESKREKYKQIKQGMMQELLTGKTRLV